MKRLFFGFIPLILLIIGCAGCISGGKKTNSGGMTLDRAIKEASDDINERIGAESKIALLNFNSTSEKFSAYVLDELTANLVGSRHLIVIDRKEIDLIRGELNFQMSGDVDDNSMQELGRMLGAQSIVSGSLTGIGNSYRIVLRVLNVQTAAVEVQYRADVPNDERIQALLDDGVYQPSSVMASTSVQQQPTTPAPPAQPASQPVSTPAAVSPQTPLPATTTPQPEPSSASGTTGDFVIEGGVLTKYQGNAREVIIPIGITSIGLRAFEGYRNLTSIVIPASVTSIQNYAFWGCNNLASITMPVGVTSIGIGPFTGCTSLTGIIVDERNTMYSSSEGVLFNKAKTVLVQYPAGKQEKTYTIPVGVTSIETNAFQSCSGLTSITIPTGVTSIGTSVFFGCSNLTNIIIPVGVTSIGIMAFRDCSSLTSITVPASVTSIESSAFEGCRNLSSITIPTRVASIGSFAFRNCINLRNAVLSRHTSLGQGVFPSNTVITYSD